VIAEGGAAGSPARTPGLAPSWEYDFVVASIGRPTAGHFAIQVSDHAKSMPGAATRIEQLLELGKKG